MVVLDILRLANYTPNDRQGYVTGTVALPDGYMHPGATRSLYVRGSKTITDPTGNHRCQWSVETWHGSLPTYPSGFLREIVLTVPFEMEAGLGFGEPGRIPNLSYPFYRELEVELNDDPGTDTPFTQHADITLSGTAIELQVNGRTVSVELDRGQLETINPATGESTGAIVNVPPTQYDLDAVDDANALIRSYRLVGRIYPESSGGTKAEPSFVLVVHYEIHSALPLIRAWASYTNNYSTDDDPAVVRWENVFHVINSDPTITITGPEVTVPYADQVVAEHATIPGTPAIDVVGSETTVTMVRRAQHPDNDKHHNGQSKVLYATFLYGTPPGGSLLEDTFAAERAGDTSEVGFASIEYRNRNVVGVYGAVVDPRNNLVTDATSQFEAACNAADNDIGRYTRRDPWQVSIHAVTGRSGITGSQADFGVLKFNHLLSTACPDRRAARITLHLEGGRAHHYYEGDGTLVDLEAHNTKIPGPWTSVVMYSGQLYPAFSGYDRLGKRASGSNRLGSSNLAGSGGWGFYEQLHYSANANFVGGRLTCDRWWRFEGGPAHANMLAATKVTEPEITVFSDPPGSGRGHIDIIMNRSESRYMLAVAQAYHGCGWDRLLYKIRQRAQWNTDEALLTLEVPQLSYQTPGSFGIDHAWSPIWQGMVVYMLEGARLALDHDTDPGAATAQAQLRSITRQIAYAHVRWGYRKNAQSLDPTDNRPRWNLMWYADGAWDPTQIGRAFRESEVPQAFLAATGNYGDTIINPTTGTPYCNWSDNFAFHFWSLGAVMLAHRWAIQDNDVEIENRAFDMLQGDDSLFDLADSSNRVGNRGLGREWGDNIHEFVAIEPDPYRDRSGGGGGTVDVFPPPADAVPDAQMVVAITTLAAFLGIIVAPLPADAVADALPAVVGSGATVSPPPADGVGDGETARVTIDRDSGQPPQRSGPGRSLLRRAKRRSQTPKLRRRGRRIMVDRKDKKHPEWEAVIKELRLLDTVVGGTQAMRDVRTNLMPKRDLESAANYDARLQNATYAEATRSVLDDIVSMSFSRPMTIADEALIPQPLQPLIEDADKQGSTVEQLAKTLLRKSVLHGHVFAWVDNTEFDPETTSRAAQGTSIRPYACVWDRASVINWTTATVGGTVQLNTLRVRTDSFEQDPDDEFASVIVQRLWDIVVPREGVTGTVQVWMRMEERNDWTPGPIRQISLPYLPLVKVASEDTGLMSSDLPLMPLGYLDVRHWVSSSHQNDVGDVARIPFLSVAGASRDMVDKGLVVGPHNAVISDNPQFKIGYVEVSGAGLELGFRDLERIESAMERRGLAPLVRKMGAADTATGKSLDNARNESRGQRWVRAVETGLRKILDIAADYMNVDVPETVAFDIFSDWSLDENTLAQITELRELRKDGVLTRRTVLEETKRRGVLSERLDVDSEIDAATRERQEASVLADAEIFGNRGGGDDDEDDDDNGEENQ